MDEELQALLARLGDAEHPLTDEELAQLAEAILGIVAEVDTSSPSDDDLQVLSEARDSIGRIRAEQDTRAEAQAERAQQAADLMAEIAPPVVEEPEPVVEPEPEPVEAVEPEPVAAAAPPEDRRLPSISHLAHRGLRRNRPQPTATTAVASAPRTLVASADIPGISAGSALSSDQDREHWARSVARKMSALSASTSDAADGERIYFASMRVNWPEERTLGQAEEANEEKINAVVGPQALVASGGICAPVAVDYTLSTIAQAARPVRDAMATFGAARGGIRFILPHTLQSVTNDGPASVWTEANDRALNNPSTKPHATFACQSVQEVLVDAVTSITQFGNFQARYFPEQIDQYMATVDAVHARLAESTLLAAITSGSTAVTADAHVLGAARDVLATIDRATAAYRYRHRMAPETTLRLVYPEWLEDMIRTDLARQLPGDSGGGIERLATTDAEIDAFFSARNVNVTTVQDSPTGASPLQGWGVQAAGGLLPWPTKVTCWLYHEGAWTFLDGGELNLGMVRDSTLNRTNDFQFFSETFEKAVFRGHESLAITMTVCPFGGTSGTVDASGLCTTGS